MLTGGKISDSSDAELVQAYKESSNLEVLAILFRRYTDLIYGVCLKYLKQPESAQDATMALFEEVAGKLLRHDVEQFRGWLHTVTKNYCLMQLRGTKGRVVNLEPELMQSGENLHLDSVLDKEERFNELEYCMGQLADAQRHAIELFYLKGKCYNEISVITGVEWNMVRSLIQNGRRNLKICMEKQKEKSAIR